MKSHYRILFALTLVTACTLVDEIHPLAVADVTPRSICAGDNYATPITLSAIDSLAIARLPGTPSPEGHCLRELHWAVEGSHYRIVSGEMSCMLTCVPEPQDCPLQVSLPGNTTADIVLTVINDSGGADHAVVSLQITTECVERAP
jgi:hypothetical protein